MVVSTFTLALKKPYVSNGWAKMEISFKEPLGIVSRPAGAETFGDSSQNRNPKMGPGKWKHGPKPAVCPGSLSLSHIYILVGLPFCSSSRPQNRYTPSEQQPQPPRLTWRTKSSLSSPRSRGDSSENLGCSIKLPGTWNSGSRNRKSLFTRKVRETALQEDRK